jgi:hypothetical protein
MPIQDVAPLPADPLASLTSDYEHAVLHLAWDRHKETRQRTLLFAWVELLPTEVPPPKDDVALADLELKLGGKSNHRVYVRHVTLSAERARRWYLGCRQGTAVLPEDDGRLPDDDAPDARRVQLADLGEEPPWPNLVCVKDKEEVVPFCPQWHDCPRVHHLIPLLDLDLKKLWSKEQEREKAVAFLSERLHFELREYPEYWGSVHLVAPNPVFRKVEVRRERDSREIRTATVVRFHPRAEKALDGLDLSIRDDRPSGLGTLCRVPLHQPMIRLAFDHSTILHSEMVQDRERGMLLASKTGGFRGGINFSVMVGPTPTRIVQVPGGKPYEVPLQVPASGHISVGGSDQPPQASSRLQAASFARGKRGRAGGQRWFHGAEEEARLALRELLYDANRDVLIVDPYFGAAELNSFAPAVGKIDVPVFVLGSSMHLINKVAKGAEVENWEPLLVQLQHITSQPYANKISTRVMEGKESPIHDRFFVVDDRIWLLGSSLNKFSIRGTVMVELPDPAPIREKLFEAWHQAEEFEIWTAGRKERRKPNGREARQ